MSNDWVQFHQQNHLSNSAGNPTGNFTGNPTGLNPEGGVGKAVRRRSRASRRTPTTLLNTDTTNFRAMVQQFTGAPTQISNLGFAGIRQSPFPAPAMVMNPQQQFVIQSANNLAVRSSSNVGGYGDGLLVETAGSSQMDSFKETYGGNGGNGGFLF